MAFCLKRVLVWVESAAPPGCQCLRLLSCEHNKHTPLLWLWTLLNSHTVRVLQNSVLVEHGGRYIRAHWQGVADTRVARVSSAPTRVPLSHWTSHTEHNSKMKLERIVRWQQHGALLTVGLCVTAEITYPWSWPRLSSVVLIDVLKIFRFYQVRDWPRVACVPSFVHKYFLVSATCLLLHKDHSSWTRQDMASVSVGKLFKITQ